MEPKKFIGTTVVLKGDGKDVGDLPAKLEDGAFVTVWEPTEEERERILAGGLIQINLYWAPGQEGFPPIAVTATGPPVDIYTS